MSDVQPRKPAGTPTGGEFSNKTGSAPASALTRSPYVQEPDDQDFTAAAEAAVESVGLGKFLYTRGATVSGPYWDNVATPADSIGLQGCIRLSDVDTGYLPADLAEKVAAASAERGDRMLEYAMVRPDSLAREESALISVTLDADEIAAAAELLTAEGVDFAEDLVPFWSKGQPGAADEMFGYCSITAEWEKVASAVRRTSPGAAQALDAAIQLRLLASSTFAAEAEYIFSDDWQRDRAQDMVDGHFADG